MQQYSALLGAVVGAVLAFVLSNVGERTRWRRDKSVRWDAARLAVYTEYCNAVKGVVHIASGMARSRGLPHSSEAVSVDRGIAELARAAGERTAVWESVLLLGDPETISAARAWHQAVWQLEFFARGVLTDQADWARALDEFEARRQAFYRSARMDLGVPGEIPGASWPPPWLDRLDPGQQAAVMKAVDPRVASSSPNFSPDAPSAGSHQDD